MLGPTTAGRGRWFAAAALAGAMLAGCSGPASTLDPAGPAASLLARMWWIMLAVAVVLQALVMGLLWLALARPRAGNGVAERTLLVGGGLLLPLLVLPPLLFYGLIVGERLLPDPADDALQIRVEAQQFAWTFLYLEEDQSRISEGVMHLPVGRPVDVHVTSRDVIHSFWIPRLGGKMDAIPGHTTVVRLQADRPGVYHGQCAEFCGTGHAFMHFVAHAHAEDDYRAAIRGLGTQPAPTTHPAPHRERRP